MSLPMAVDGRRWRNIRRRSTEVGCRRVCFFNL
nr:MAG TPA: hypothetical protein [Caudoviricetes sp.]